MIRLSRDFFEQDTLIVAKNLLGKSLFFKGQEGIITETEAYIGMDDPACHAARGKTPRNEVMFGKAGFSYVYLIYGMYHCLNFVTEKEGFPAAVLIRGLYVYETKKKLNGPGKLCRDFGITKNENAVDTIESSDFYVSDNNKILEFEETPRIGIKLGTEKLWRFVAKEPF